MTIKSGKPINTIAITTSDTTLVNPPAGESRETYGCYIHNTSAADDIDVELFLSDDATSAAGERVYYTSLAPGRTLLVPTAVVAPTRYLIGKCSLTGVNFFGAYTQRTGTDA